MFFSFQMNVQVGNNSYSADPKTEQLIEQQGTCFISTDVNRCLGEGLVFQKASNELQNQMYCSCLLTDKFLTAQWMDSGLQIVQKHTKLYMSMSNATVHNTEAFSLIFIIYLPLLTMGIMPSCGTNHVNCDQPFLAQ